MKQRLDYIDILRCVAIFLVVLGHVTNHSGYSDSFLSKILYSFHMPLFMCISGFVTSYSNRFELSEARMGVFVWKKIRPIVR